MLALLFRTRLYGWILLENGMYLCAFDSHQKGSIEVSLVHVQ